MDIDLKLMANKVECISQDDWFAIKMNVEWSELLDAIFEQQPEQKMLIELFKRIDRDLLIEFMRYKQI